jgi:pyridoxamine 5'-phosphate oxidase
VASEQSRPIASRADFLARIEAARRAHGERVPRPARWGGYRVWAERVELWAGQPGRAHDRAVWSRALQPTGTGFTGGAWRATRLQP